MSTIIELFLLICLFNFLIVESKNSVQIIYHFYLVSQLTFGFSSFKIIRLILIFIIFILHLFMFIKVKLTFKSISLVRIKYYLLMFNKDM